MEYEEAKRKTKESLHPLKVELAEITDSVSLHARMERQRVFFFYFRLLLTVCFVKCFLLLLLLL